LAPNSFSRSLIDSHSNNGPLTGGKAAPAPHHIVSRAGQKPPESARQKRCGCSVAGRPAQQEVIGLKEAGPVEYRFAPGILEVGYVRT
jgi:hypothetical protein